MIGRISLHFVEDTIENEIRSGGRQRDVAKTYALGIQSDWPTDWGRVNRAIVERWPRGLLKIKRLAWAHCEGVTDGD